MTKYGLVAFFCLGAGLCVHILAEDYRVKKLIKEAEVLRITSVEKAIGDARTLVAPFRTWEVREFKVGYPYIEITLGEQRMESYRTATLKIKRGTNRYESRYVLEEEKRKDEGRSNNHVRFEYGVADLSDLTNPGAHLEPFFVP